MAATYRNIVKLRCQDDDVSVSFSCLEPITDSPNTDDVARLCRLGLDLLAQLEDVRIHDPVRDENISARSEERRVGKECRL